MRRLLLLLSLCIFLVSLVLRKVYADRVLRVAKTRKLHGSPHEMARKMLKVMGHSDVELQVKFQDEKEWLGRDVIGDKRVSLLAEKEGAQDACDHGLAALRVGLYLLLLRDPEAMARRRWAKRFGHVFPIFTFVVLVFVLSVGKLPAAWALSALLTSVAIATLAQIAAFSAERSAAEMACVVLEKKRIFPRLSEEEAVIEATRAWAWRGVLPGILSRML